MSDEYGQLMPPTAMEAVLRAVCKPADAQFVMTFADRLAREDRGFHERLLDIQVRLRPPPEERERLLSEARSEHILARGRILAEAISTNACAGEFVLRML